jgi:hypothetical protein
MQTKKFLIDLCSPERTPRVPKNIRQQANWLLRHYPSDWDMDMASRGAPDVFQPKMEDLHRFLLKGKEIRNGEPTQG